MPQEFSFPTDPQLCLWHHSQIVPRSADWIMDEILVVGHACTCIFARVFTSLVCNSRKYLPVHCTRGLCPDCLLAACLHLNFGRYLFYQSFVKFVGSTITYSHWCSRNQPPSSLFDNKIIFGTTIVSHNAMTFVSPAPALYCTHCILLLLFPVGCCLSVCLCVCMVS